MKEDLIDITQIISSGSYVNQGTGSQETSNEILREIPFDKFIITIKVSQSNEFLGIESIEVNKDFMSYVERLTSLSPQNYHDVDEYYNKVETD